MPKKRDPNELLSTATAAEIAGVTVGCVNHWCLLGQLPSQRPGRSYVIRRGDLDAFLAAPRKRPGQYDRAKRQKRQKG